VGERQAFEVTGAWATYSYLCHTGLGQCIEITPFSTYPSQVTIRFARPDPGTSGSDGGGAIDGQTVVDAPDRAADAADGQLEIQDRGRRD
jgi:hypothetical protein